QWLLHLQRSQEDHRSRRHRGGRDRKLGCALPCFSGAVHIVLLPTLLYRRRLAVAKAGKKPSSADGPLVEFALKFRVGFKTSNFAIEHLQQPALYRKNCAYRFPNRELDGAWSGKAPVHGERRESPVRFDDGVQGNDSILRRVGRTTNHEIPVLRG